MRLTEPTEVNSFRGKAARFLGYSAMGIRRGDFTGGRSWRSGGNWGRTFSVRREAGGWVRMKESYVEGVAAHNGPESCGVAREGGVEALTGETAGWVLSREMLNVRGADAVEKSGR
jgi:hypothetical protein